MEAESAAEPEIMVRSVRPGDLQALVALRAQVGWGSGGLEGSLAAALEGRQAILVAERCGVVVGTVTANFFSIDARKGCGHISDLAVAPAWQRRGIGGALLEAAEEVLRRRGLQAVTLDVDADNRSALRLYLHHGYRHLRPAQFPWGEGHTLHKSLVPAAPRSPRRGLFGWLWRRAGGANDEGAARP